MAKIIAKKTRASEAKVRRQLEGSSLTVKLLGQPDQIMSGAQALLRGRQLLRDRRYAESKQIAEQLIRKYPAIVDAYLLYIQNLVRQDDLLAAREQILFLLDKAPVNSGVLTQAGKISLAIGDADRAVDYLKRAYQVESRQEEHGGVGILLSLANCYAHTNESEKSRKIIARVLQEIEKKSALKKEFYVPTLLEGLGYDLLNDAQVTYLENRLDDINIDVSTRSTIAFGFAELAKKAKQPAREMAFLEQANEYLKHGLGFDLSVEQYEEQLSIKTLQNMEMFSRQRVAFFKHYNCPEKGSCFPISIIGMPRSGTTLLEQMLGSHSRIGQVGESKGLSVAINRAFARHHYALALDDFPTYIDRLPPDTLSQLRDDYIAFQRLLTDKSAFVEKELSSYKYVGLTANLFPEAKFIHMNRAPLDIFLSCCRGSITGIKPTCSVPHMAIYYLQMKKLIGHWKELYPDRVYILEYAKLVNDPEVQIKKVLEFLGLNWEEQILQFHKRKNVVRTLSVDQVRQGIYTSSVNKWEPFREILEPAIEILQQHGVSLEGVPTL